MDIMIACMHPHVYAMETIDLTINDNKIANQGFKSDFLVTPADCRKGRLVTLARDLASFLLNNPRRIPEEVIAMVDYHKIGGSQGSG